MTARGRPPVPRERMKARSPDGKTPGHRNLPAPMPQSTPDHTVPALPEGIADDSRGAVEWEKIWTAGFWLKRDQDYHWVEMIARAYSDMELLRSQVTPETLIVTGYAGQQVANPLIAEVRKLESTIQKCLQVLGFSPTDRARLAIETEKAEGALARMIKRVNDRRES